MVMIEMTWRVSERLLTVRVTPQPGQRGSVGFDQGFIWFKNRFGPVINVNQPIDKANETVLPVNPFYR